MIAAGSSGTRVQELNDEFRKAGPRNDEGGRWLVTREVQALGDGVVVQAVEMVRAHDRFTEEDDPWGEHDFGAFELAGRKLFWKIDYYDRAQEFGSPDPADASVTCRVMTILLVEEY